MTPDELKAAAEAAREISIGLEPEPVAGGREIRIRVPTARDVELLAAMQGEGEALLVTKAMLHKTVDQSVIGWRGITVADVLGDKAPEGTGHELQPFDASIVGTLFGARPEWYELVRDRLLDAMEARKQRLVEARKNLRRA